MMMRSIPSNLEQTKSLQIGNTWLDLNCKGTTIVPMPTILPIKTDLTTTQTKSWQIQMDHGSQQLMMIQVAIRIQLLHHRQMTKPNKIKYYLRTQQGHDEWDDRPNASILSKPTLPVSIPM
jgi:hypothetical protein